MKKAVSKILALVLAFIILAQIPPSIVPVSAEPITRQLLVTNIRTSSYETSQEGNKYAWAMLDGEYGTHWHDVWSSGRGISNSGTTGHYIDLDLGSQQTITSLEIYSRSNNNNFPDIVDRILVYTTDGQT